MLNIVDCDVGFLSAVPLPALPCNGVQVAAIEKPLRLLTGVHRLILKAVQLLATGKLHCAQADPLLSF